MQLRNSLCLRLVQLAAIGSSFILTAIGLVTLSMSVNEAHMVPYETSLLIDYLQSNGNYGRIKTFIQLTVHGSLGMGIVGAVFSPVSALSAGIEHRCTLFVISVLSALLSIGCTLFGVAAVFDNGQVDLMIRWAFEHSVYNYTNLYNPVRGVLMQKLVDRVQMEGRCCGFKGLADYDIPFQEFRMPSSQGKFVACIEQDSQQLGPQQIPFTCCDSHEYHDFREKTSKLMFHCVTGKFVNNFMECPTKAEFKSAPSFEVGCRDKLQGYHWGMLLLGGFMFCTSFMYAVIAVTSCLLAVNIVSAKEEIVNTLRKDFDLSDAQLAKLEKAVDNKDSTMLDTMTSDVSNIKEDSKITKTMQSQLSRAGHHAESRITLGIKTKETHHHSQPHKKKTRHHHKK